MSDLPDLIAQLQSVEHFRNLPDADIRAIINAGGCGASSRTRRSLSRASRAPGCSYCLQGQVHLRKLGPQGRNRSWRSSSPVIMFNEVPVLDGGPNLATAVAVADCLTWQIGCEAFQALLQRYPQIGLGLLRVLARRNRFLVAQYEDISFRSVQARAAKLLLDLSNSGQQPIDRRKHPNHQMAARIATVPEAFSRALHGLQAARRHHLHPLRDHRPATPQPWLPSPHRGCSRTDRVDVTKVNDASPRLWYYYAGKCGAVQSPLIDGRCAMLGSYCPGSASLRNNISLEIKTCPECGADVELFSIDRKVACEKLRLRRVQQCPLLHPVVSLREQMLRRRDGRQIPKAAMKGNIPMAKVKRQIITIDEEKCDGCGQCVPSCAEGALRVVDGKARLDETEFLRWAGACLGECPQGALHVVEMEVEAYDEPAVLGYLQQTAPQMVEKHVAHLRAHGMASSYNPAPIGVAACPSVQMRAWDEGQRTEDQGRKAAIPLSVWGGEPETAAPRQALRAAAVAGATAPGADPGALL